MREMKFRCWDKINKHWINAYSLVLSLDGSVQAVRDIKSDEEGVLELYGHHQVEVMQYTGLKDKNGKEIYEGDIINDGDPYHNNSLIVEYNVELSGYCPFVCDGSPGDEPASSEFSKVIGNIYENPELIKEVD